MRNPMQRGNASAPAQVEWTCLVTLQLLTVRTRGDWVFGLHDGGGLGFASSAASRRVWRVGRSGK